MAPDSNTWKPPVLFHFSVEFQWMPARASASFAEVDGLGQELVLESNVARSGEAPGYPKGVKVGDIVLKRALEPLSDLITIWVQPLSDLITIWVQCCFNFTEIGWIEPCNVAISLLDEEDIIVARWHCLRAIPIKWSAAGLDASKSGIATETLTLRYTKLIRII